MGNSLSRVRKLPRTGNLKAPQPTQLPNVAPTRIAGDAGTNPGPANVRDQAQFAQLAAQPAQPDGLVQRLNRMDPVQSKPDPAALYRPAAEDGFTVTLQNRARVETQDAAARRSSGPKTGVPPQTITEIVRAIQAGESPADIMQTYNLAPGVLDKLKTLRIPPAATGRRRGSS